MSQILQWTTGVNNGFGLTPPGVKVVSKEEFDAILTSRIDMMSAASAARRAAKQPPLWCDDAVILMMKDERATTDHMIVVAEAASLPAGGAPVLGTIKGLLTMGHDKDRDPETVLTLHGACANTPEYLEALLRGLTGSRRLRTFGITHVKSSIFASEVPLYTKYGFRVVSADTAGADVVLAVASVGGRRKSKTMRTKRKRMTRRNRVKQ